MVAGEEGEVNLIYSDEYRKKKIRNVGLWGIFNTVLCGYILFLLVTFWNSWSVHCVRKLNFWLLVYLVLQGLHMVRSAAIIFIYKRSKDPSTA